MKRLLLAAAVAGGIAWWVCHAIPSFSRSREQALGVGHHQTSPAKTLAAGRLSVFAPGFQASSASANPRSIAPIGARSIKPNLAPEEFQRFEDWCELFRKANSTASEARGRALAWKRREAMLKLIQEDPQKALALTMSYTRRQGLPPSVTQFLEVQVDGTGSFEVAIAEGVAPGSTVFREVKIGPAAFKAFVYGRRLGQGCGQDLALHGVAIDGKLALDSDPIRVLERSEAVALDQARGVQAPGTCMVCGRLATGPDAAFGEMGGQVAPFCGVEHLKLVNKQWLLREKTSKLQPAGKNGLNVWSLGPKTVLYMRVNFPDDLTEPVSEGDAYLAMDRVNDFYVENSYDLTSLTTMVTPLLTLPLTKAAYGDRGAGAVLDDARAAAKAAGYDTAFFDFDIVCHTSVPGFGWAGLGFVGAKGTWLQSPDAGVTAHELGHNYGVLHANFWNTTTNNSSGIGPGVNLEYGNKYDTMGAAAAGRNHFNAYFKNDLKWLANSVVASPPTNGLYRLYSYDLTGRVNGNAYAARVRKDFQRDYWIEFRQQFGENPGLANGLFLNWSPWSGSDGGTDLIDATPDVPGEDPRDDAPVLIGRTFSDAAAGVHLTPLARGVDGTNWWIDLQVNTGAFAKNRAPRIHIQMDPTAPQPGDLVHFHADAQDPDGDSLAYAWWFDNTDASTNNLPWASRKWSRAGSHIVRCVVSDMKGGVASANLLVTVGTARDTLISGTINDTNGFPVEGARVDNLGDPDACAYIYGYTDSDGRYVLVAPGCDANLTASKYGFTFANLTWTNPISAGSNALAADFLGFPLPVLTVSQTPAIIPENSTAPAIFSIARTGDTSTNLLARVYLTGSATLGGDYTLKPTLTNGLNDIEFPPGTNVLEFTLQPRNDNVLEGPETVTLTLAEDDLYVLGSLGEGTITIQDDELQALPSVSVTAKAPYIPENGTDAGEAVFTRTGTVDADLYVYYSTSGTATPGVDYVKPAGVVLIPAGRNSSSIRLVPIDDKAVETDETIEVALLPDQTYGTTGSPALFTIVDDDVLTVTISAAANAREPGSPGFFVVKREGDMSHNLQVLYSVTGSAENGSDYVALPGELLIPAGAASAEIVVTPIDDLLLEGDESVTVALTNTAAYDVGTPGSATLRIADNELPTLTISATDTNASEPGDNFGQFVVSRGTVTRGALPVYLAISGTALNGIDYVPLDNVVVIPDGARQVAFDVIPFDDLHAEPTENVLVGLLPNTNYNVGLPNQANVTIDDDDYGVPAVGFTFSASSAPEAQSPGISLSLSAPSAAPITVNYRVIGGTASTNDYILPPGPLTIDPGLHTGVLPLRIRDNSVAQANRTIRIALYDPVSATLDGIKIHTYTIIDDDSAKVSISATVPDAYEAGRVPGSFRIARAGALDADLEVLFQVAGTASAPADYAPLGNSVVIPAGAAYVDLPVVPVDDQAAEDPETVILQLIRAPGASLVSPSSAVVTIHDNDVDLLPVVAVTCTNAPNAVEGGAQGRFVFYRSNTNGPLNVSFTVTGTAGPGTDYVPLPTSISFPDGQNQVALAVTAVNDSLLEGEETIVLSLTQADTYRVMYFGSATMLVQDNEQRVQVDASDFVAAEPGNDRGEFTFTRVGTTNGDLRVYFELTGTALNGIDYVAITNPVVIPSGFSSVKLAVEPLDDALVEGPETVTLTLLAGTEYAVGAPDHATVTIEDDEPGLTVTATTPTVVEGSLRPAIFTLRRTGDPSYSVTVPILVGGSATFGEDYPAFATNVFFPCGIAEIDLAIYPVNELLVEGPETVTVEVLPNPAYTIGSPSNAVVTIVDAGLNQAPVISVRRPASQPVNLIGPTVTLVLDATVNDDGGTNTLTNTWSKVSGPADVLFENTNSPQTTVTFPASGFYVIRLTADDGVLQSFQDITVNVTGPTLLGETSLNWPMDEGTGTNVNDVSGYGRNGQLLGAPQWVTNSGSAGALQFAGGNDCVQGTGTSNLFNRRKAFSLSIWFNPAETNLDQTIICANPGATNGTITLSARHLAPCGQGTNVFEATLRSTDGLARYVSSSFAVRTGWHNLLLTWTNASAISLYLDGQPDQPGTRAFPLEGELSDAPEFFLGKGTVATPADLRAQIDDVVVFPRALGDAEARGIGSGFGRSPLDPNGNFGPIVDAGTNVTIQLPLSLELIGTVTDDGLPVPPGLVSNYWLLVSGPAAVNLPDPTALTNTVRFPTTGTYVFRLLADDGDIMTSDDVTITVIEPTQVDIMASDYEGSELGPDTAEFTLRRAGDTTYDFTVYLAFSGIATNGLDFEWLTNAITFSGGTDTVAIVVKPYLDHRTEGDQDVTITIQTNLAYTIGNGQATVIIHDSPYGSWTIDHFTLEELTDPALSGETADFDHDGLSNFVEYASGMEPKLLTTNAPLATTIVTDPADNAPHVVLTYHRRLSPRDVLYLPSISSDLLNWQSGTNYIREIQAQPDTNGITETVTAQVRAPLSRDSNLFVTVKVWLATTQP